jgi:hypothetical protein
LWTNWVVGSSAATCDRYTMSKIVDTNLQSKVQWLEVNLLWIFLGAGRFGEGMRANNGDTYDNEVQLEQMISLARFCYI